MTTKDMKERRSRSFPAGRPADTGGVKPASKSQPLPKTSMPRGLLRTLLSLTAPGFVIVACIGVAELTAPHEWKPSVLIASAMSDYENELTEQTLAIREEAEQRIAEARAEGERAAEIRFQEDLKEIELAYNAELQTIQANLQSGMDAYKSLYDRANMIQQAVYQMEGVMLNYRQQAIRDTQGANSFLANAADIGCVFMPEFCGVSDNIRTDMADQLNDAGRRGAGSLARDYLLGLPDPAQLQGQLMLPPPAPQER